MDKIRKKKFLQVNIGFVTFCFTLLAVLFVLKDFSFVHEDAWLTHRYTKNLASGLGLVSHPGLLPDEGFSSLSWVSAIAFIAKSFNIDVILAGKILAYISFIGTILMSILTFFLLLDVDIKIEDDFKRFALKCFGISFLVIGIGWSQGYLYWVNSLLETPWYAFWNASLLYLAARIILLKEAGLVIPLGILCALSWASRPEGIMNGIGLYTFLSIYFYLMGVSREIWRRLLGGVLVFAMLSICLLLWRFWYFDDYISSAAYVKLGLRYWARNARGYLTSFILSKGVIFSVVGIISTLVVGFLSIVKIKKRSGQDNYRQFSIGSFLVLVIGLIFSQVLVVWYTGGEPLGYSRFLLPQFHTYMLLVLFGFTYVLKWFDVKNIQYVQPLLVIFLVGLVAEASLLDKQTGESVNEVFMKNLNVSQYFTLPREKAKETINYRESQRILKFLHGHPGATFAHTEYGIIPWFIGEDGSYIGNDILGLNTRQVARNFKYYPFEEVFYAFRDYILTQTPGIMGCHSVFKMTEKNPPLNWTIFQTDIGPIKVGPAIAWAINPYFESEFFLKHYSLDVQPDNSSEWPMFYFKNNLEPASKVKLDGIRVASDRLMHGFVSQNGNTWASKFSRIYLDAPPGEKYFCIRGKSGSAYNDNVLNLSVRINKDAVGDYEIGKFSVEPKSNFNMCLPLPNLDNSIASRILFTIVSSPVEPLVRIERKQGFHYLSFIINEVGVYGNDITQITKR